MHLTYLTIDSISEGVGSSQILPLLYRLSSMGIEIHFISFEKEQPAPELVNLISGKGIEWTRLKFGRAGILGGISRLAMITRAIGKTDLVHARSDIPTIAGLLSNKAPVVWDVRSLWGDQRAFIESNRFRKIVFHAAKALESICARRSAGMSTLTAAIVPLLNSRHKKIPTIRTVVSTAVDLDRFTFNSKVPPKIRGLYSGTYNNYYDLEKSHEYIIALQNLVDIEVHWARPHESHRKILNAGETQIYEVTQNEMASVIPQFSFGISICKQNAGPSLMAAMPTKVAEFLASGRPVVVSKGIGDLDQFFSEFRAGIIVDTDADDFSEKAKELLALLSDPDTPTQCRSLAEKYFDFDEGVKSYLDLYRRILKN